MKIRARAALAMPPRIACRILSLVLRSVIKLSMMGFRRGPHVTRYYMYMHLSKVITDKAPAARVLSISQSVPLCRILGLDTENVVEADYPEASILSLPFGDCEFDYVVSDQVLEHVEGDPQEAINETIRILKPGGLAIHTTCLMTPIHRHDFWRFTPDGLRHLCGAFSEIIDVGGWGNPYVVFLWLIDLRFEGVPEARWHPYHRVASLNDPTFPIVTWVVARK